VRPDDLKVDRADATVATNLSNRLKLSLSLSKHQARATDPSVLSGTPRRDNEAALTLRRRTESGFVSLSVQARQAAENIAGLRLDYDLSMSSQIRVSGNLGLHQRAVETPLLRIGGMRSGLETNVTYALTRAEYLRFGLGWQRYASQDNVTLGSGRSWNAEVGSHLRIEYPNLTLRAFVTGNSFDDDGRIDPSLARFAPSGADLAGFRVLPFGSVSYGVALGIGTVVEPRYTRALRPFFEVGVLYNRDSGRNINLSGGVAGSLLGQDVLTLRFQRNGGTPDIPRGFQEMGLNYKWLY